MADASRHRIFGLVTLGLGAALAAALGGVLGLLAYVAMRRRGASVIGRSKLRFAAVAVAVLVLVAGFAARATTALVPFATCRPVADQAFAPAPPSSAATPLHTLEGIATAAPSGLAIVYATAAGADFCVSPEGFLVAERDQGFVSTVGKGALIGDVFLSWNLPQDQDPALAQHEARHRVQWTVATMIGGPLAFPAAYELVDFFFPGGHNPFERDAGLKSGAYDPTIPAGPVLGMPQLLVLALLAAGVTCVLVRKATIALVT